MIAHVPIYALSTPQCDPVNLFRMQTQANKANPGHGFRAVLSEEVCASGETAGHSGFHLKRPSGPSPRESVRGRGGALTVCVSCPFKVRYYYGR